MQNDAGEETIGEGKGAPGTDTKENDFLETPDGKQTNNNHGNENEEEGDYRPTPYETSETEQNNRTNLLGNENGGGDYYRPTPQETSETEKNNRTNSQENEGNEKKTGEQMI